MNKNCFNPLPAVGKVDDCIFTKINLTSENKFTFQECDKIIPKLNALLI